MADIDDVKHDDDANLHDELDDQPVVLLGLTGTHQHMQPMTAFQMDDQGTLYFFSSRGTDLVGSIATSGRDAMACHVGKDHKYHACIHGTLALADADETRRMIDENWSPVVSAWYDGGKDDPELVVLRFTMADAAVWASKDNALKFGWEVLKANLTGDSPDIGYRRHVNFSAHHA